MEALRKRGVVRSSNNPVADYTENLVSQALGARLQGQSSAGYDAIDDSGVRYQIKGRRLTPHNRSTQLSILRDLDRQPFDILAAVIYSPQFEIEYAALIPIAVVLELSAFRKHTRGHIFHFRRSVLTDPRTQEITDQLRQQANNW